jgi:hypothetical protein
MDKLAFAGATVIFCLLAAGVVTGTVWVFAALAAVAFGLLSVHDLLN